jgi:hypothetical protein
MATGRKFTSLKGPLGWGVGYTFFTVAFLCMLANGAPRYDQVVFVVGASILLGYLGSLCGVLLTPLPKKKRKAKQPSPLTSFAKEAAAAKAREPVEDMPANTSGE